jgi:hypothetical protein
MRNYQANTRHSRITLACVGLLLCMVVLYLYFLNMSVVQVVMRIEHVQKQNELNAEIASLEAKFIEAQHGIASKIGTANGYDTDSNKIFVSRDQERLVMNNQ